MRILTLSTLYPDPARPRHGIFVENRLRALKARGHDESVEAPVPYIPFKGQIFGEYGQFAAAPKADERFGMPITHPRYLLPPKLGMNAAVPALTHCFRRAIAKALKDGFAPDLIDAHYYYPDGVAAVRAADAFGLPCVITARGTDINLIPQFPKQRQMILETASKAAASITVADALREEMIRLGADGEKIITLRNGVDLTTFSPGNRIALRQRLRGKGPLLLSVGHLIDRKGHDLVIRMLPHLPDAHLVIVGDGPEQAALDRLAEAEGVRHRVQFLGEVPHTQLRDVYGSADLLVLASSREGWPNVLLEAMACGTPCVAAPIWGCAEIITAPAAGRVAEDRTVPALVGAAQAVLRAPPLPADTRTYAEQFGWDPVAKGVEEIWGKAVTTAHAGGWGTPTPIPPFKKAPRALLTVDAEECFDWKGDFSGWSVPPLDILDRVQNSAKQMGFTPLYFVTYPLLEDEDIAARLKTWIADGQAHAGLHLHSWSTPPLGSRQTGAHSFQCQLAPDLHREKLSALIQLFHKRLGAKPIAHRAGRYGIAPWVLDQLVEAGVPYDFSPSAGFDFSHEGGPDFSRVSALPHHRTGPNGSGWIFPVSGASAIKRTDIFVGGQNSVLRNHMAAVRLTPEGNSLSTMKAITQHLLRGPDALLTPSLHLSSLVPGATPYAKTDMETHSILDRLITWWRWAQKEGVRPIGLDGVRAMLSEERVSSRTNTGPVPAETRDP